MSRTDTIREILRTNLRYNPESVVSRFVQKGIMTKEFGKPERFGTTRWETTVTITILDLGFKCRVRGASSNIKGAKHTAMLDCAWCLVDDLVQELQMNKYKKEARARKIAQQEAEYQRVVDEENEAMRKDDELMALKHAMVDNPVLGGLYERMYKEFNRNKDEVDYAGPSGFAEIKKWL
ncbi:hypothetical protein NX059_003119 [Plenodomus lindquistii]|nr:hypothetical protein NX059_003119 [Plenodomus lindquistii]